MGQKEGIKELKYKFIQESQRNSISKLCALFKVSRSGFYRFIAQATSNSDLELAQWIRQCHQETFRTYGYRRVKIWLIQRKGVQVNAKRLLRVMNKYQMLSVVRRKKKGNYSGKVHQTYPNHLGRNFTATQKNQKWATDISYIYTSQGVLYLSVIQDLFDRSIVAYETSTAPNTDLVLNTLKKAQKQEKVADGILLHSDQGVQYTSLAYKNLCLEYRMTPSMSRRGNCLDNCVVENFFGTLKTESVYRRKPRTFEEAKRIIGEYIRFYNQKRLQLKTKLTPQQVRSQSA